MRPGMEWVVLLLIVVIVFGWKQLPNIARSMGRSARVLRSEVDELKAESRESKLRSTTVPGDVVGEPVRADADPLAPTAPLSTSPQDRIGSPLSHMSDAELEAELRRRAGESARSASDLDLEAELRRRAERRRS